MAHFARLANVTRHCFVPTILEQPFPMLHASDVKTT